MNRRKFKALMIEYGYNQQSLSEELGMSTRTFYSRLHRGDWRLTEIKKLMDVLHIKDPRPVFFN